MTWGVLVLNKWENSRKYKAVKQSDFEICKLLWIPQQPFQFFLRGIQEIQKSKESKKYHCELNTRKSIEKRPAGDSCSVSLSKSVLNICFIL